jgi:hypothetical protein
MMIVLLVIIAIACLPFAFGTAVRTVVVAVDVVDAMTVTKAKKKIPFDKLSGPKTKAEMDEIFALYFDTKIRP